MREWLICELVFVLASIFVQITSATVVLKPSFISFADLPAKSARAVNCSGICGALHVADPIDACTPLRRRFSSNETELVKFALIVRGECSFEDKIRNAQIAGFHAAVVFDDRDKSNLVYMMVNPAVIRIHAVFVSKVAGDILKRHAQGVQGECCIYPSRFDAAWTVLAISFISLLVILVFLVIALLAPRNWHWRWVYVHSRSIDNKMVEALPSLKFNSTCLGDSRTGETCAICLEDYKDGEVLKVLPCQHEFHSNCVDSWLTKGGTFCPVCKLDLRTKLGCGQVNRWMWLQNP